MQYFQKKSVEDLLKEGEKEDPIKLLKAQQRVEQQILSLKNEQEKMLKFGNPHIVLFLGSSVDEKGNFYLISELMEKDLNKYIETSKQVPLFHRVKMGEQIALALNWFEGKIVHSDLKPSNILLQGLSPSQTYLPYSSKLKITDFGLSKSTNLTEGEERLESGTPAYSPPLLSPSLFSSSTDCWSFGLLLLNLITWKTEKQLFRSIFQTILSFLPKPYHIQLNTQNQHTTPPSKKELLELFLKDEKLRVETVRKLIEEDKELKERSGREGLESDGNSLRELQRMKGDGNVGNGGNGNGNVGNRNVGNVGNGNVGNGNVGNGNVGGLKELSGMVGGLKELSGMVGGLKELSGMVGGLKELSGMVEKCLSQEASCRPSFSSLLSSFRSSLLFSIALPHPPPPLLPCPSFSFSKHFWLKYFVKTQHNGERINENNRTEKERGEKRREGE